MSHQVFVKNFYRRLDDPEPFWLSPAEAMNSLAVLKTVSAQGGFTHPGAQ